MSKNTITTICTLSVSAISVICMLTIGHALVGVIDEFENHQESRIEYLLQENNDLRSEINKITGKWPHMRGLNETIKKATP